MDLETQSPSPLYCLETEDNGVDNDSLETSHKLENEEKDETDFDEDYIQFPRANCPEKIVLCIDMSSEMNKLSFKSKAGDRFAPSKLIKRALGLFLETKSKINSNHEYAVVILQDKAYWACDFTRNPKEVIKCLDNKCNTVDCNAFDLSSIFTVLNENIELPEVSGDPTIVPPPYIVRTILIYGRSEEEIHFSDRETQKFLESSPYFFLDAFYIHEPLSDDNKCEETFNKLCELDYKGLSYIFETSRNPTKLHVFIGQLLSHPLQRPLQNDVNYKLQND